MKTPPDKTVAFLFVSHPTKSLKERWNARLTFPAGSASGSMLPIEFTDGEGAPIGDAVFEFAGRELPVKDGRSEISYDDFIRGKHSVPLWLHRKGVHPIPGGLTFG